MSKDSLPHNLEAEQALLAGCLINPGIIVQVGNLLKSSDLHGAKNRAVFEALVALGEHAEIIQVRDRCPEIPLEYLASLTDAVSTSAGWRYHADIILDCSRRRQLITACQSAITQAVGHGRYKLELGEATGNLTEALRQLDQSQAPIAIDNLKTLGQVVDKAQAKIQLEGVHTGFEAIDSLMGIMEPGQTVYLAARPSVGKSALALAIIDNVLRATDKTVILYSLEMTGEAIMRRRLSTRSGVYLTRLRHGNVEESQWPDIIEAANYLGQSQPIIVDNPQFKQVERLAGYSRAIARDKPIGLIVVDHIQKMSSANRAQSRHHELSYVSERLCDLAKDLRCPVLVLCQLRRPPTEAKEKRPRLEDMKESGDLEANADIVLGLYREDKSSELMEVQCLKNRDGAAGWTAYLGFDPPVQSFRDSAQPEPALPYKEDI